MGCESGSNAMAGCSCSAKTRSYHGSGSYGSCLRSYYTEINYAKGLFIWIFNKSWFSSLPADLQKTFREVVRDVCADYRAQGAQQEIDVKEKIKKAGIQIFQLPGEEMDILRKQGYAVHEEYADEINKLNEGDTYRPKNFLKEVQDYVGYKQ